MKQSTDEKRDDFIINEYGSVCFDCNVALEELWLGFDDNMEPVSSCNGSRVTWT